MRLASSWPRLWRRRRARGAIEACRSLSMLTQLSGEEKDAEAEAVGEALAAAEQPQPCHAARMLLRALESNNLDPGNRGTLAKGLATWQDAWSPARETRSCGRGSLFLSGRSEGAGK